MLRIAVVFLLSASLSHAGFFDDLTSNKESKSEHTDVKKEASIPLKHSGEVMYFNISSGKVTDFIPAKGEKSVFNIVKDSPNFTNFASASVVNGKIIHGRDVNGGTCFGVSYFTHMWFSRITDPILNGGEPQLSKTGNHKIGLFDVFSITDDTGTSYDDGVTFAVFESMIAARKAGKTSPFSSSALKDNPDGVRLKAMSKSEYKSNIMIGMIAHHDDQSTAGRKFIDAAKPKSCEQGINKLKGLLQENKTQAIFFRRFHVGDKWYEWSKLAWGHAVLLYRISKVDVNSPDKIERKAWKLHFFDPNFGYNNTANVDSGEGFGTYLLYFPQTKQLTFSERAQSIYTTDTVIDGKSTNVPLLTRSTFIDDEEVKFGYYDIWEGHSNQDKLARSRFFDAAVGKGRVLTAEEEAIINSKGKLELKENVHVLVMNDGDEPMTDID